MFFIGYIRGKTNSHRYLLDLTVCASLLHCTIVTLVLVLLVSDRAGGKLLVHNGNGATRLETYL